MSVNGSTEHVFCAIFRAFWVVFEAFQPALGPFWSVFEAFRPVFRPFWAVWGIFSLFGEPLAQS